MAEDKRSATYEYRPALDGVRLRSDGLHYTPDGVQRIIAPWLLPRLAAVADGTYPDDRQH